ncbi:MAG TPA: hypothetical protein PK828_11240 [Limnochordia bacterium]|nr:hypothetical protein [Limnochordia bacterium]
MAITAAAIPKNRFSERGAALERISSQFTIAHDPGNTKKNNYHYSIAYGQYEVRRITGGVRIDYQIVEEWRPEHYVPHLISQERMNTLILPHLENEKDRTSVLGAYDLFTLEPLNGRERPNCRLGPRQGFWRLYCGCA